MSSRHFTVLGAGIVGVCCAIALQMEGYGVTLVDRDKPGNGCSFGNAGMIQVGGCVPIAMPGVVRDVPRMLFDPDGPLVIRWRHLPSLMPYLLHFLASARPAKVEATARTLTSILRLATSSYAPLIEMAKAEHLMRETGELYVYRTREAFEAAGPAHQLRRRNGVEIEPLVGNALRELEPALSESFTFGMLVPGSRSTTSPYLFIQALTASFLRKGGVFLKANVDDITVTDRRPTSLTTDQGERPIDGLVLALGAHSKRMASRLGSYCPLDTERGYHLTIPDPGIQLDRPVIVGEHRFGLSSMVDGLRIAGTAELGALDMPANFARAHRLLKLAKLALPDLQDREPIPWMGQRPSTPDSLPVICAAPNALNTFFAFGHGHAGLTLGAITGRIIADLTAGRAPPVDIQPFDVRRFSLWPSRDQVAT